MPYKEYQFVFLIKVNFIFRKSKKSLTGIFFAIESEYLFLKQINYLN